MTPTQENLTPDEPIKIPNYTMTITKLGGFSNTALVGNITYRQTITFVIVIVVGLALMMSPIFKWNWFAMAAYIALASVIIGQTPTQRSILTNIYGIVFKKPIRMVVSEQNTVTTFGHGVREVILDETDIDAVPFKMSSGMYALVYNINSNINNWSTISEYVAQAAQMKKLFNILEGSESVLIVEKQDSDTGMLQLRDALAERENFEGDDLQAMSDKRQQFLYTAATSTRGRSIQQYAVLLVKPKNAKRVTKAMKSASRLTRPATHPADILLAISGLEGGVEGNGFIQEKD